MQREGFGASARQEMKDHGPDREDVPNTEEDDALYE